MTGSASDVVALPILAYSRWVSPLLPARCRFAPTCSSYAVSALEQHGMARGSWLAVRRVARCHPFHPGGHDPVPPVRHSGRDTIGDDVGGAAGDRAVPHPAVGEDGSLNAYDGPASPPASPSAAPPGPAAQERPVPRLPATPAAPERAR